MITVCDRRYLEKPIHIVCWACMSLIQCGKVLLLALEYDNLFNNTKGKKVKSKSFVFQVIQVMKSHCVNRPIILCTSLISYRDQCVKISGEQRVTTRRV